MTRLLAIRVLRFDVTASIDAQTREPWRRELGEDCQMRTPRWARCPPWSGFFAVARSACSRATAAAGASRCGRTARAIRKGC